MNVSLEFYEDADFAKCIDDRNSIHGYAFPRIPTGRRSHQIATEISIRGSTKYYGGIIYGGIVYGGSDGDSGTLLVMTIKIWAS